MNQDGLAHCLKQSLAYLAGIPPDRKFGFGKDLFTASHMAGSLERFAEFVQTRPEASEVRRFIEEHYWVYRSAGSEKTGKVLFTGYYEPLLVGYSAQTPEYPHPIYARPDDIVSIDLSKFSERFKGEKIIGRYADHTVVPYPERKAIDTERAISQNARPLAWVKDPVDLFFLHIQGSGKVYLLDGGALNVHYHTTNGRPYRSIGKLLIETEKIPRSEMSMQAIRRYLNDHPQEVADILNHNPSYVFFKTEADGPLGYLEVKLTPGRSLAVDRRIFPLAALAYIETEQPLVDGGGKIHRWIPARRFGSSQDTGGAIRGPGRADLFWGNGPYAEIAAGHLRHPGNLYFLVLKPQPAEP